MRGWRLRLAALVALVSLTAVSASLPVRATAPFTVVATINATFSSEIVVNGNFAYVASGSAITVISTTSNTIVDTVSLSGVTGPQGAATIGSKVYFADPSSGKVIILDTGSRSVSYLTTTGCGSPTLLLAYSSTRLVVDCRSGSTVGVQVINVAGPSIVATLATGSGPRGMSTSGNFVYVPNSLSNTMSIVNVAAATPVVVATVAVGSQPEWTAPLEGKVFVANFAANTVSILNGTTGATITSAIAVGNNPQGIYPCDGNIYAANRWSGTTSVISPTSNSVTKTITLATVGAITHVMGVNGSYAYFLNFDRSSVSVVDCASQTLAATVTIAPNPQKIAFSDSYAYVTGSNQISVIAIPASSAIIEDVTQRPPDWLKQVGRPSADAPCESGWSPSWAEWPNGGTGGFTCEQTLTWSHAAQQFVLR
jgi:YVTN family beta-propeller protein